MDTQFENPLEIVDHAIQAFNFKHIWFSYDLGCTNSHLAHGWI